VHLVKLNYVIIAAHLCKQSVHIFVQFHSVAYKELWRIHCLNNLTGTITKDANVRGRGINNLSQTNNDVDQHLNVGHW